MKFEYMILLIFILLIATVFDIKNNKIPNFISLTTVFIGLSFNTLESGVNGFIVSMLGACIGLVCFLPFYLKEVMGAGDVKLMAAVGSFTGIEVTFFCVIYTFIAGGILALGVLIFNRGSTEFFTRYFRAIKLFYACGQFQLTPQDTENPGTIKFPYALAIAIGSSGALLQFGLWQRLISPAT